MPPGPTPAVVPRPSPDGWAGVFVRTGAVSVPIVLLAAAVAVRADAHVGLPGWVRAGLFLGLGTLVGVAVWGWSALRPRRIRVGVLATALAAVSIAGVPGAADRLTRFAAPWYVPPPVVDWEVVVSSGDPVVEFGRPVTLTAYLRRIDPAAPLPTAAACEFDDGRNPLPMTADGRGAFRVTLPTVESVVGYRIVVGDRPSFWHTVTPARPAELAAGTSIRACPPAYAADAPIREVDGWATVDAYPNGELAVRLRFSRPPQSAALEWIPATVARAGPLAIPLDYDDERLTATARVPAVESGTLAVRTVGEHGLSAEYQAFVSVPPDHPPVWTEVNGIGEYPLAVRPGERPAITLAVADDLGLASVAWEVRVNDASPVAIAVACECLPGATAVRATARLPVPDGVRVGDRVAVRLIARDRCDLPRSSWSEGHRTFPASGWIVVEVRDGAADWDEQQIVGQKEDLHRALAAVLGVVTETEGRTADLAQGVAAGSTVDESVRVSGIIADLDRAVLRLATAARAADLRPETRPFAFAFQDVEDRGIGPALGRLIRSPFDPRPAARRSAYTAAADELAHARGQLRSLARCVDDRTGLRLARVRLARIGDGWDSPADDRSDGRPSSQSYLREMYRRYAEIVEASPRLGDAVRAARRAEVAATAARLTGLADDLQLLAAAIAATDGLRLDRAARPLHAECRALAERLVALAAATNTPLRVVDAAAFDGRPIEAAGRELGHGRLAGAMTELEKAAREADRVGAILRRAADARSDPRETVQQLAAWVSLLGTRFTDARDGPAAVAATTELMNEIAAVEAVLKATDIPDPDQVLAPSRSQATAAVRAVIGDGLPDPEAIARRVAAAQLALKTLADRIPTRAQQLQSVAGQLDRVRRDQQHLVEAGQRATGDDTDPTTLRDLTDRQADVAAAVRGIDLPGFAHRQHAVSAAITAAEFDLKNGRRHDIPVSLRAVLTQIDRFRTAVAGSVPDDQRARELAVLHQAFVRSIDPDGPTKADLTGPVSRQIYRELQRQFAGFSAPDARPLLEDIRAAMALADRPAEGDTAAAVWERFSTADELVRRLADRLNGRETDLARVEELAGRARAAQTRDGPGPPTPVEQNQALDDLRQYRAVLNLTRAGQAHAERATVESALADLGRADPGSRHPELVRNLAVGFTRLADAMKANGDCGRREPVAEASPPVDPGHGIQHCQLPDRSDADVADLAATDLRALRDRVSGALARLPTAERTSQTDSLSAMRDRLKDLSVEMTSRILQSGPPTAGDAEFFNAFASLIRLTAAGHPEVRTPAGRLLGRPPTPTDQGDGLTRLTQAIVVAAADPDALAARQSARRIELADESRRIVRAIERMSAVAKLGSPFQTTDRLPRLMAAAAEVERVLADSLRQGGSMSAAANQRLASTILQGCEAIVPEITPLPQVEVESVDLGVNLLDVASLFSKLTTHDLQSTVTEEDRKILCKSLGRSIGQADNRLRSEIMSAIRTTD